MVPGWKVCSYLNEQGEKSESGSALEWAHVFSENRPMPLWKMAGLWFLRQNYLHAKLVYIYSMDVLATEF